MMVQKLSFTVGGSDRGLRLDQFLARQMTPRLGVEVSRRRIRRLIADGAVYVKGRRTRIASRAVQRGQPIDVFVDVEQLGSTMRTEPEVDLETRILFEDDHLLAIDKPSGMAVQATINDDVSHLLAQVGALLARRLGRRPDYLTLPHRLDRGTSGIQLFAKTRLASAALSESFRERRVGKTYLALCAAAGPALPDEWSVSDRLDLRRAGAGHSRRSVRVSEGGRRAETDFTVRERAAGVMLVEARPKTGRMHQIRVHLADSGVAVLGDPVYGSPQVARAAPRLMLHATELRLPHPIEDRPLHLESALPKDFAERLAATPSDQDDRRSSSIASP